MAERKKFEKGTLDEHLAQIARELKSKVYVYIIGGYALMVHGLRRMTKDVDIVFMDEDSMKAFTRAAKRTGFKGPGDLPEEYRTLGSRNILDAPDGVRFDIFVIRVCDALSVSETMYERASKVIFSRNLILHIATPEDIFLFKSITNREGDLEDMARMVGPKFDWDIIEQEIRAQKDSWVWLNRVYARLLEFEEEKGVSPPLIKKLEKDAEVFQAMGIVLEKLEDGPLDKKEISVLLKEEDTEFVERVISELKSRRLVSMKAGRLVKRTGSG
jgi:hypothetical protein